MFKTPGVYVKEISTLPPSVAEVSTAIPAFIGCTKTGPQVAKIETLLEFELLFGGAQPTGFKVQAKEDPETKAPILGTVETTDAPGGLPAFLMYYCMSNYFSNGGGPCFVIPAGDYSQGPKKAGLLTALQLLEKEDEPTLIVLTDAVKLDPADYHEVCVMALAQCSKLQDRFAIFDVPGADVPAFRQGIGTNALMYGAAYHPYLRTSLNFHYRDEDVVIEWDADAGTDAATNWEQDLGADTIVVRYSGPPGSEPAVKVVGGDGGADIEFIVGPNLLTIRNVDGRDGNKVATDWVARAAAGGDKAGYEIDVSGDGTGDMPSLGNSPVNLDPVAGASRPNRLAGLKEGQTALFNLAKAALARQRVVLPPSAAMAGIYARVDRQRGVWKAPANVSLSAVIGPTIKITHGDQEDLNVDSTAGKSINAIRAFTGKGTLVWGARTLAGNDNEWRYIPVRRLFILIEESIQKSTAFAVFEPNDATTWLKVKGMIESYLYSLWERGALAGPTPESAYYVSVGLGKTMTTQDILEGRMNIEVGVAAVRPAEFIILRFSHKLQEA